VHFKRSGRTLAWDGQDGSLLDFAERHGIDPDRLSRLLTRLEGRLAGPMSSRDGQHTMAEIVMVAAVAAQIGIELSNPPRRTRRRT
jgi:hypothetical protein